MGGRQYVPRPQHWLRLGRHRRHVEKRQLGGKCADINALYIGLARAAGFPRATFTGFASRRRVRLQKPRHRIGHVTKAQHCRAEVFLKNFGWVPVDPADVRKVMLEEAEGGLAAGDLKVVAARKTLRCVGGQLACLQQRQ